MSIAGNKSHRFNVVVTKKARERQKIQSLWALTLRGDRRWGLREARRGTESIRRLGKINRAKSSPVLSWHLGQSMVDCASAHDSKTIFPILYCVSWLMYINIWSSSWLSQLQSTMSACDKGGAFLSMCSVAQEHMTVQLRKQCSRDRNLGFAECVAIASHHLAIFYRFSIAIESLVAPNIFGVKKACLFLCDAKTRGWCKAAPGLWYHWEISMSHTTDALFLFIFSPRWTEFEPIHYVPFLL